MAPALLAIAALAAATLLVVVAAGYFQLFSSFARYDDEGYVHLSLRTYLAGHPLYDETYTQYGPAYFHLEGLLHHVTGWPVTHDVARWKTLLLWLTTAALAAATVWRLTVRPLLAVAAFAAAWLHLDRLGLEPGHPQELALPLLTACLWGTAGCTPGRRRSVLQTALLLGVVTGTLGMIKANLGLLAAFGCTGALVVSLPRTRGAAIAGGLLLAGLGALPFALAGRHAASWNGVLLPVAVACGCAAILIILWYDRDGRDVLGAAPSDGDAAPSWSVPVAYLTATLATCTTFAAAAVAEGTSFGGLWYGLVGQHRGFLDLFYHHPPLPEWSLGSSLAGLLLAIASRWWTPARSLVLAVCPVLLLIVGLRTFSETWSPIDHGMTDRAAAGLLAACVPPIAWVLLCRRPLDVSADPECGGERRFGRLLLCLFAVLQPLGMYPTPGTQTAIGTLPAVLLLLVGLSDLWSELAPRHVAWRSVLRPVVAAWGLLLAVALVCRSVTQFQVWRSHEPLGLAGAELLRLPPEEAADRRRTVDYLRRHADTFFATPSGCCSLYLWAEMPPPTTFNATFWEVLLNHDQQQDVIAALERAEQPRLVVDRRQSPVIHRQAPLHQYVERRFSRLESTGSLEVWGPAVQLLSRQ